MNYRFIILLLVATLLVSGFNNVVSAYAPSNALPQGFVINTRVLVVFAGIDNETINSIDLEPYYLFKLYNNVELNISLKTLVLSHKLYENITSFIDENSKYMKPAWFMKEYLEAYHSEWSISTGCYVRADVVEEYLYDLVQGNYNTSMYDYVLFLLYYPRSSCLRTYYIEKYFWEIHSTRNYTGLVAFGGNTPLFFIDFSAIPVTHPDKTQPLYGYGEPVDIHTFKPLWDLKTSIERASTIRKYILDYLGFLVLRELFNDRLTWTPYYVIDIHIVDYTGGEGYRKIIDVLNTSTLYHYLRGLLPYSSWHVNITRVYANSSSLLLMLLENSTRRIEDNRTWIVMDYTSLVLLISGHLDTIRVTGNETIIPVYIFVANKPIHFTFNQQLNFTGAAVPKIAIIVSYPGYYYRILEEGMGMVIAHEVGHLLGLTHPFEGYDPITRNETMIWLYDYIASPMSYAPTLAGWLGGLFRYDAQSLCRYHVLDLIDILSRREEYSSVIGEALKLLSRDQCLGGNGALELLLEAYNRGQQAPRTSTLTTTATETITIVKNNTITIREEIVNTTTVTETSIVTTTATETTTYTATIILNNTITELSTIYEARTSTITIEKLPEWAFYSLGLLIVLSIIAIASTIIVSIRRV